MRKLFITIVIIFTTCLVSSIAHAQNSPVCGNGICEENETYFNCPSDCSLNETFEKIQSKVNDLDQRLSVCQGEVQDLENKVNLLDLLVSSLKNAVCHLFKYLSLFNPYWTCTETNTTTNGNTTNTTITGATNTTNTTTNGNTTTTNTTSPIDVKCWSGSYKYLAKDSLQAKKFCKCAMGLYGFMTIYYCSTPKLVYMYVDSGKNNNWNVTLSNTTEGVSFIQCPNFQKYSTDKDYLNII